MDYYSLKIGDGYWTIQKTSVDCKRDNNTYEGKDLVLISPRGRGSIWSSSSGGLRLYTDKTVKHYYSYEELKELQNGYLERESPGEKHYYSQKLKYLLDLIPDVDEECISILKLIEKTKIQKSHKQKKNREEKDKNSVDNYFGLFDDEQN